MQKCHFGAGLALDKAAPQNSWLFFCGGMELLSHHLQILRNGQLSRAGSSQGAHSTAQPRGETLLPPSFPRSSITFVLVAGPASLAKQNQRQQKVVQLVCFLGKTPV